MFHLDRVKNIIAILYINVYIYQNTLLILVVYLRDSFTTPVKVTYLNRIGGVMARVITVLFFFKQRLIVMTCG